MQRQLSMQSAEGLVHLFAQIFPHSVVVHKFTPVGCTKASYVIDILPTGSVLLTAG